MFFESKFRYSITIIYKSLILLLIKLIINLCFVLHFYVIFHCQFLLFRRSEGVNSHRLTKITQQNHTHHQQLDPIIDNLLPSSSFTRLVT